MLERARGLSAEVLGQLAELESATLEADGGRLKLEWGVLAARSGDLVDDLLWWSEGRLVGFAGLYAFGGPTVEVTGMVEPRSRRLGIGSLLLDEALGLCRERGFRQFLLVVPRTSIGGRVLAESHGGVFDHAEHAMVLVGDAVRGTSDPLITFRVATPDDLDEVSRILTTAFGHPMRPGTLESPDQPTMVAERGGRVIGTLRIHMAREEWGVYGFAVDPGHQGRGVGRDLLRRVCRSASEEGVGRVHLEVEVQNDRALNLYTSLGFARVATEDYFDVPL